MKLEELTEGESARIVGVGGEGSLRKRILDLGMTKGCRVTLIRKAPLGDPLEVELRGYRLTVRKSEASSVEIEKEGCGCPDSACGCASEPAAEAECQEDACECASEPAAEAECQEDACECVAEPEKEAAE